METLGQRIKRLRLALGLSRGQLAMQIGSPTGAPIVRAWELGHGSPNSRWVMPLATALRVSAEELLEGSAVDADPAVEAHATAPSTGTDGRQ